MKTYIPDRDASAYQLSDIYDKTASGDQKIDGLLQFANQRLLKMSEL